MMNQIVLQLSWLERYTDNVEVGSSTLPGTTKDDDLYILRNKMDGGLAQLARAPALQAGGHRFESDILHTDVRAERKRSEASSDL